MKKRSVAVQAIVDHANAFFKNSANECVAERKAIQSFVATLLMEAKSYNGFGYLYRKDVEAGKTWGINFDTENGNHSYPDDSRIRFN